MTHLRHATWTLTLAALLLTIKGYAYASQPSDNQPTQEDQSVAQQITQATARMHTLTCGFTQTKQMAFLNDALTATGKMYFSDDGRLCWQYVAPYTYTFIINNDKVMMRSEQSTTQVDLKSNTLFQSIARIMMNSVSGRSIGKDSDFSVSISSTPTTHIAVLTPLKTDMKKMFNHIDLHFDRKLQVVTQVDLYEKNGDTTQIRLTDIRINQPIDASVFAVH